MTDCHLIQIEKILKHVGNVLIILFETINLMETASLIIEISM